MNTGLNGVAGLNSGAGIGGNVDPIRATADEPPIGRPDQPDGPVADAAPVNPPTYKSASVSGGASDGDPHGKPDDAAPDDAAPDDAAPDDMAPDDGAVDDGGEPNGPIRRCALSRLEHPIAELIRFVRAPDGTIVPDIASKLPGRGVWIEAKRSSVEEAVRRGAFAKSLKKPCSADAGLGQRVEDLLRRRLIDALGLANKAGLVISGFEKLSAKMEASEITVLLHGSDAAADGSGKLDRKFAAIGRSTGGGHDLDSVIVKELTIDEMSLAIGRPNVVHVGLRSGGATLRLLENASRLRRFRAPRA